MTGKTRAKLRSLAMPQPSLFQIGKGGITDELLKGISQSLDKRELVKITVLKNCPSEKADVMRGLCEALKTEPIALIGNKIVIYRRSEVEGANHIEL